MIPWVKLGRATLPDGSWLELRQHGNEFVIAADGYDLMVSRVHASEVEMVTLACAKLPPDARILVGGLGMGYTLRAALDAAPPGGRVIVAELLAEVVEWNEGPLGELTDYPLRDPRTEVALGDVGAVIRANPATFDAILLDVDNGPDSLVQPANRWLYTRTGLAAIRAALRPKGTLAVWSVVENASFEPRLRTAGFKPSTHRIRAHGTRALVFLGRT
ncbi:MAG: hypothetical protein IT303_10125 [Dehalococcoidia bacterium]|nr:hypothetical protein [Dehalococcoidia bacterium]